MKKAYQYILVITLAITFMSCDTFLEEPPSKSAAVAPKTLSDYEALLNNYQDYIDETPLPLVYGTDDYELSTTLFDGFFRAYGSQETTFGTWNTELGAFERIFATGWPEEWQKVFNANLILDNIGGVPDATDEEKANLIAEAHFIRAYSYFVLANIYCLPYTETNKAELGLPIRVSTTFSENLERATLEETYALIESDLMNAFQITRSFGQENGLNYSWRASTAAVNGFAARFYLALNDYIKAQEYAQAALDEYDVLRNYNTDMRFSDIPAFAFILNPGPTQIEIFYPYTHDQRGDIVQDRFEFGESYYFRQLNNRKWNTFPSQDLLSLYDQTNDLRYKFHVVEDYSYTIGAFRPPFSYPGYIFFHRGHIPNGPSVPEMLLIKAECQARQGMWAEGLGTVNILRAARMDVSAPASAINLSAVSQTEAVTKILEERRREMPFVHRWYDVRRYNNNSDPSDDVIMTRTFYPFTANAILSDQAPVTTTLDKNSRKFAFPIPDQEIVISNGALEQNKY
ncbi:RagB/SusD family nutrient uptake outer membrane protein [Flavivirga amylovorans]|uniref:RagB/SusD family nutrient uptake outer membrane protein n=1 Tax=Flavivirga amylovorans TaxID=870486 RepID=A0ABT8WVX2_9FLAO|nr:RagB/SusD family nutrient uptake outer membrane protein [Flavivirga amylovorans]MDO5985819.1 RagB/SusD family nutrient uptake outer membrane protein [Flavivirga amylovorans]